MGRDSERAMRADQVNSQAAPAPQSADALVAGADLALAAGRQGEAMAGYRQALSIQPSHAMALVKLASLLLERGFEDAADLEGGIEVCRAAIGLLPDPAPAHALLGRTLLAAGRAGEAVEAYRAAAALDPADPGIFSGLAMALIGSGELEQGLEVADAVLAVAPGAEAWCAKGRALLLLHRPAEAAQAFVQGLGLDGEDARLHLGLGEACAGLDLEEAAIIHLARAAELDPASKWAHAQLGAVLSRKGDLEPAERHCRRALELDPELAIAHRTLSGVLAEQGRAEEARRHRDVAYGLSNLEIARAPRPRARVLLLTTSDSGNIPYRHLLPADRYTRIEWFIEYAREGQAAELPPYDAVFNIVGDPDHSGPVDAAVAAFVAGCGRRVLNHPSRVGPTRRDRLPGLLAGVEDLVIPKVARLEAGELAGGLAAAAAARGLEPPLLARPFGAHGGAGVVLARTPEELAAQSPTEGVYLAAFHDFASPSDGLYRKYRAIFVDRRPFPYHLAISPSWLVHYETAGMRGDAVRQAEELAFLQDPQAALGARAWAAVGEIGRRLDLDYAGVDFSLLPDGRVLVFEANATMLVHPESGPELAHKNPFIERITSAFQALVEG